MTPVEQVRRALADGSFGSYADAGRCADAIIASADAEQPPRRLILGSATLDRIERTLAERLDAVRRQRSVAASVDGPA